jgi:LPS-assembly protein
LSKKNQNQINSIILKFFSVLILFISGIVLAFGQIKETSTIKARNFETNPKDKSVTAVGDVEILKGRQIFKAEKIIYRKREKIIEAEGKVKVDDATGNNFFANKAIFTDDATQGEFYNAGIIFDNGSSISSPHITRENKEHFLMRKPKYFLCPTDLNFDVSYDEILQQTLEKKRTLFSITSSSLKIDQAESTLTFKHAIIKVWGVPVFYLPYLKTKHPLKGKQTGFEAPELRHNTHYLYGVFLPYYIKISDTQNLRLRPGRFQKDNTILEAQYNNDLKDKGKVTFRGAVINDRGASKNIENSRGISELQEGKYKKTRGYGELRTSYKINDLWSNYNFGTLVSDDYVLRDYYQNYSDYLQSNINFYRINKDDNNILQLKTLFFQEIMEEKINVAEQTPQYIPIIDSHLETDVISQKNLRLTYNLDSNITSIQRTTGLLYNRATITPSVENKTIVNGNIFKNKLSLRGDGYFFDENYKGEHTRVYNNNEYRAMMGFDSEWKLPLINYVNNSKFIVEPMVKYMYDTNPGNLESKIPNEDSQSAEISYSNIFAHNRYGGYDRMEYGNRVSYGVNSELYNTQYGTFTLALAQGYRDQNDDTEAQLRGFEKDFSDVVGKMSYDTKSIFDIYYRFRLDRATFTGKSNELTSSFKFEKFRIFTTYTMLKAEQPGEKRQEQMTYGGDIYILKKWTLSASATRDFVDTHKTISKAASINYDGACTGFSINFTEYTPKTLIHRKPDRNFRFNFFIKSHLF